MRVPDTSGLSPTQARRAAGEVTMVIDEVREIANRTLHALATKAKDDRSAFVSTPVDPGMFGEVPLARELGEEHRAAHQVFTDTLQGVLEDLEAFRDNLRACADSQEATDESVQAGLLALGRRYDHRELASDRANQASWQEHGRPFDAAAEPGAAPTEAAPADAAPAEAAPAEGAQTRTAAGSRAVS